MESKAIRFIFVVGWDNVSFEIPPLVGPLPIQLMTGK
jgi:hypothetical protein